MLAIVVVIGICVFGLIASLCYGAAKLTHYLTMRSYMKRRR